MHDHRYSVYSVQPAEMQPERDHNFEGEDVGLGKIYNRKYRDCWINGWFSFTMEVLAEEQVDLVVTYLKSNDTSVAFDITADGKQLGLGVLDASEPLTVAIIAEKFNYNKDYLARLFKQHTSMGPLEYIHSVRVNKAKELLTRTALNVREIATETGFTDDKYFMHLFRKYENMTPTQYRNAYHKTFMNND